MICPVDGTELRISDRQGIEIDYCPQCRGVWLDRGELDKMIERAARSPYADEPERVRTADRPSRDREYDRDSDRDYRKKSKRRSFLEDLLDFD
ncbi:MAG: zf-TFIIB domain-containing protein [Thermomicrobiales bacterium]